MSDLSAHEGFDIPNLPMARLHTESTVISPGNIIQVQIEINDKEFLQNNRVNLEMRSSDDRVIQIRPVIALKVDFPIESEIEFDDYELQIAYQDYVLDRVAITVTSPDNVTNLALFAKSLHLRENAYVLVEKGEYETAVSLIEEATILCEQLGRSDLGASGLRDFGELLLSSGQYRMASKIFHKAQETYEIQSDAQGIAFTSFLRGRAELQLENIKNAWNLFENARDLADTIHLEIISLRSREELLKLASYSSFFSYEIKQRCTADFFDSMISVKSQASRNQAILLGKEVVAFLGEETVTQARPNNYIRGQEYKVIINLRGFRKQQDLIQRYFIDVQNNPWDNILESYKSKLITKILLVFSDIVHNEMSEDVDVEVVTSQNAEEERCAVFLTHSPRTTNALRVIQEGITTHEDLDFYRQVASILGASVQYQSDSTDKPLLHILYPKNLP
jgi:tetratricopeptide (TPR) repeat protein